MYKARENRWSTELTTTAIRTTLALPSDLLAQVDQAVREGRAASRNALVADAIREALHSQERARIDAEFAEMATDAEYHAEVSQLARQFEPLDVDSVALGEQLRAITKTSQSRLRGALSPNRSRGLMMRSESPLIWVESIFPTARLESRRSSTMPRRAAPAAETRWPE